MNCTLLIIGFFLLVIGADYFVDGSCNIAKIFKIPPIIIGLTIVAFVTSTPEAVVSITASLHGQNGMAIGNIISSNIFNVLMVVGSAGFVKTLYVERSILSKEFPFLLISSILIVILSADKVLKHSTTNILSRFDGLRLLIFFVCFVCYLVHLIQIIQKFRNTPLNEASISIDADVIVSTYEKSMAKSIVYSIGGIIAIVIGGRLVVVSTSYIASAFGLSVHLIGLTIG